MSAFFRIPSRACQGAAKPLSLVPSLVEKWLLFAVFYLEPRLDLNVGIGGDVVMQPSKQVGWGFLAATAKMVNFRIPRLG